MSLLEHAFEAGALSPDRIAGLLRTTKEEIAETAGLSRDGCLSIDRVSSAIEKESHPSG